jgi:P27 family predicted phage terminase small subunit
MAETIPVRSRRDGRRTVSAPPNAPRHLSPEGKTLWKDITGQWVLGADGLALLRHALEARDQYEVCRRQVAKDGPTFTTESGQIRAHPAAKLSLDFLSEFRMGLRQLGLQPED